MKLFVVSVTTVLLFFTGCVSRLGYPVEKISLPTEVTVRYDIQKEEPVIPIFLDDMMTGVWKNLHLKRINAVLDELNKDALFDEVGVALEARLLKYPKLFTPVGTIERVTHTAVIPKKSPKTVSGYDFSTEETPITTKYVLMYQLIEYGYKVTEGDNGAFLKCAVLLIERETGTIMWKTSREELKKVPFSFKGPHGSVTTEILADSFSEIIPKSINEVLVDLVA